MCSAGAHTVGGGHLCYGDCVVSEARGQADTATRRAAAGEAPSGLSKLRGQEPSRWELVLQVRLWRRGTWGALGWGHATVLFPNAPYRTWGRP